MPKNTGWTREQLLVAFSLYCHIPFGKFHSHNPEIIEYAKLINRTPSALAMKLSNIASLDPAIISTGRVGLQRASLADKEMWDEMQANWEMFANNAHEILNSIKKKNVQEIDPKFEPDKDYVGNDKILPVKVRIGQSFFRKTVLSSYDYKCCITGLAVPNLLIASHIIPWKDDEKNRLNPRNGLCLSALHDKAFDTGIITIADDYTVQVSRKDYSSDDTFYLSALLKYDGKPIILPDKFYPNEEFLEYHRNQIFLQ